LEYTHQPWSSPREEGLRSKWDEPRDPAASLADQTLRRRAAKTAHTGSAASTAAHRPPTMAGITGIGGDKFSGKPSDWPDTKTEIIGWLEACGYSYIAKTGTILFHFAGSGDHDHLEDGDLERHYASKMWPTQLRSIRSQVTKSTLDVKCEEYQSLSDDEKLNLRNYKVVEWFRRSNSRVVKALRDHLLPKREKGGQKSGQLRQLFMTAHMTSIINGDNEEIDLETAEHIWDMPVIKLWADILALFEGKGRSGSSSFWSMMCAAVKSVNPSDKAQLGDFALARNELQSAWQSLSKMYENEASPLATLIDRLQAEQHLEMMRLLARHPQEGTVWEDAYKQCVAHQGTVGSGLTLEVTEKYATEAMNILAQPVRGGAQQNDARRESKTTTKATDKEVLRGYVERMVEEKLADRRKQTPGKAQPLRGGQGARAKRESAQAKKDAAVSAPCDHCGKKHAGECWYKPGSKKRARTEKKALKAAAELSRVESGEDTGSEVEETFDNYSRVSLLPPSSRIPRTCTVLHANLFIATPTRNAYPDTQAEVSITNTPEHVVRNHSKSAKVQGLLGKPQIAQYADLAFRLKTDKGRHITLRIRKPGPFLPEAKEILLAHQDLEDSGFRVDYHTGKMRAPKGQMITMIKSGAVWQIPVMSPPKHTVLAATTTAPTNVTPPLDNMRDVEHMHEVLCCAGTTSMLRYYDHYHGTGFGKARKADVREFRCPIKALMQGAATQKRRRLQTSSSGTKEVHAHAAHLDDEEVSCACCADQQPKRVHFAGPWPTLHSTADRPPEQKKKNVNRRRSGRNRSVQNNQPPGTKHFEEPTQGEPAPTTPALRSRSNGDRGANGSRPLAQGERTTAASAQPLAQSEQAQGEPAQGEPAQGEPAPTAPASPAWQAMPARYSTAYRKKACILKQNRAPHDEWHIDWAIMGQHTLGLNGEEYALVVLDVGSGLVAVINTKTREDPWKLLDELAVLWGNHPKAIRGDGAAEFEHADGFKTWRRKHNIAFNPVEPYRHTMQGYIENLVKQMKVHSRCILKHANLPARFWSETTTMYMAVRNIMPTDKMKVPFTAAPSHRLHFDPKLMLHRPGCLVVVKYPKDHPRVTDTSNGARGVCGIFLGCHATSPLVKVWIPSTGEIAYHKEVEIFDDKLPFVDPSCMPDRQGFSDKDIEALHRPNKRKATRASPRTPAPSASPALVHAANDAAPVPALDAEVPTTGDEAEATPFWRRQTRHWRHSARNDSCCSTWEKTHFSSTHGK
jgi:hypothetical protein